MDEFYETIGHSQGVIEEIVDRCIKKKEAVRSRVRKKIAAAAG